MSFEALLDAVSTGNIRVVKELLEGSSIEHVLPLNEKGRYATRYNAIKSPSRNVRLGGRQPCFLDILTVTAWRGHIDLFKYLLENPRVKEKINSATNFELGRILSGCEDVRFLDWLLEVPAFLRVAAETQHTELKDHAYYGRLEFVKRLLTISKLREVEILNQKSSTHQNSALSLAIGAGHTAIIDHILGQAEILTRAVPAWDTWLLLGAVQRGNLRLVQQLFNAAEVYGRGNLALDQDKFGVLNEAQDHNCLKTAIKNKHLDIVFVLLVAYKRSNQPLPDDLTGSIEGYTDLNDFYRRYKPSVAPQFDPIIGELRATPTLGTAPNIVFSLIARYAASSNNTEGSSTPTTTHSETALVVPVPAKMA